MISPANISAFIVANPGRLRDSMKAVLRTIPALTVVGQADDIFSAIPLVGQHQPNLLVVGSAFSAKSVEKLLVTTKAHLPDTYCVVLADSMEQWWLAKAAGADNVLLSGFSSIELCTVIEGLLINQDIT